MLAQRVFRFLASLKLAVIVILGLSAALAAATFIESIYDIPTGKYWVYRAPWFNALLALLGLNILVVALSRWPWRKRHTPFLLAHLGILLLLAGSFWTQLSGVDANLVVSEGEAQPWLESENALVQVRELSRSPVQATSFQFPWLPPHRKYSPRTIPEYDLEIKEYLSRAEPFFQFSPITPEAIARGERRGPALQFVLQGGPMDLNQTLWLWGGEAEWSYVSFGPAQFILHPVGAKSFPESQAHERGKFEIRALSDGALAYRISSGEAGVKSGVLQKDQIPGRELDPGWMGMKILLREWIPDAINTSSFTRARIQYGADAPTGAILVVGGAGVQRVEKWLGLGDRTQFNTEKASVEVSYVPAKQRLPFSIHLEEFRIDHYAGTRNPMEYSSLVRVRAEDGRMLSPVRISMNEPLKYGGYTFYQSSYIPAEPRPITSVLSVNRDPGRFLKYLGSFLIVLGSVLLFYVRLREQKSRSKARKI
jgi:hypothetical protein